MNPLLARILSIRSLAWPKRDAGPASSGNWSFITLDTILKAKPGDRERLGEVLAREIRAEGPESLDRQSINRYVWNISTKDVTALAALPRDIAVEVLGVASNVAYGFVREAALKQLEVLAHPRATAYVLLRLGDWVPQVRAAASQTLEALLQAGIARELIEHHRLVDLLRRTTRVDLKPIHARLMRELCSPRAQEAVEHALACGTTRQRLFCLRALSEPGPLSPDLVEVILNDPDPTIRAWLAGRVVRGIVTVNHDQWLQLLNDRASSVCTTIIRSLTDDQILAEMQTLLQLTLSDARAVRRASRFVIGQDRDFASMARERITGAEPSQVRAGWIGALGETGDARDFETVLAHLTHPSSRVRAATVEALATLNRDRAAPIIARSLEDSSGVVRRAVVRTLASVPPLLWIAEAERVFERAASHQRYSALEALVWRAGWSPIPTVLKALLTDDPALHARAWQAVTRWWATTGRFGWIDPDPGSLAACLELWPSVFAVAEPPLWAKPSWIALGAALQSASGSPRPPD